MVPEQKTQPDVQAIRGDLAYMVEGWQSLPEPVVFELRAFKEHAQPQVGKFAPDWIDEAVEWAANMNNLGFNIYAVRNPIRANFSGSASDKDIVAAFFLWADFDEPSSTENIRQWTGPKYSAAVTTGRTPAVRVHTYWRLEEPCLDLALWRETQISIAAHFKSDGTVINPSRIMRVGGTVAYPDKRKRGRGYVSELTTFRNVYEDERRPVTIDQMRRAFGTTAPAPVASTSFTVEATTPPLDRERAKVQALSGTEWHNAVIRLVASYVAKGLADDEIHALTDPLTIGGYTVEQTRREVQSAIDGARRKGWTPEAYPDVSFDTPSQPAATKSAALEWFRDIQPALTDSYLVKGVIGAGAMSVVYGPSNSGKTFFCLDLAFHLAAGREWRGLRVKPSAVLYLAAEGGNGVSNRIAALRATHGPLDLPLALRRAGMDLLHSEADLQTVFDLAKEVMATADGKPLLIVIDTLSRVMAGGDENSPADMTALIKNVDAIRQATGAHIMVVHHSGKDVARGARGHSSLRAATDTEIEVQNENGARAAQVTKQRDYQGGETFAFDIEQVFLGMDQDGDDVSSCVVVPTDSEEFKAARVAAKGKGRNQQIIMDAFDQMVAEGMGKPNPGGVGMPESGQFWAVNSDELRTISIGKITGQKPAESFRQAWEALSGPGGLFCTGQKLTWRIDRRKK